ncbi:MAG TPA: hypothetical protein RMH99_07775, partial [Sandaracinaceae bacterium LLY-WYZ-13_1]|nr:hypothetical protein [Sandaracinaceae bacterium LLY-WYZ-13_1]
APVARVDGPGPLCVLCDYPAPSSRARRRAMDANRARRVGEAAMRADMRAMREVAAHLFAPGERRRNALAWMDQHGPILVRLAPYPVDSILSSLTGFHSRYGPCPRSPAYLRHCNVDFEPPPADPEAPPYRIARDEEGVVTLEVRRLTAGSRPEWEGFAADASALDGATGIVLDLRAAVGSDPRPLLDWLESITGRRPLAPLRAIRRPEALAPDAQAYRARFAEVDARDPAVWRALMGSDEGATDDAPDGAADHTARAPIVAVVGRHCHAACELVARALETWADATVIGGVDPDHGRLARDDPAVRRLTGSGIDLYYFATEYRLAEPIEAATGPTAEWRSPRAEARDRDVMVLARRLVRERAGGRTWPPPCDAFRAYPDRASMPAAARGRLHGERALSTCENPATPAIRLRSPLPASALRDLVGSCPGPHRVDAMPRRRDRYAVPTVHRGAEGMDLVTRLAQNPAIDEVRVECQHPPQLH